MSERRPPSLHRGTVLRSERLTPHMIRVVLGGPGLKEFAAGRFTDHYVKLQFPQPGTPEPFDPAALRQGPRETRPLSRTYTVRAWDEAAGEVTLDFVHHGDSGVAGPWAASAQPGDELWFAGPGGGYAPDPTAGWHLFAGDESALPAIGAALERLPREAVALAFIEVENAEEEQALTAPPGARLVWLHRLGAPTGERLVEAVRAADLPDGRVHAFVHGEATFVKDLRRHLRFDRGFDLADLSISGYWRRGHDENAWQAGKSAWNQQVEQEEARA